LNQSYTQIVVRRAFVPSALSRLIRRTDGRLCSTTSLAPATRLMLDCNDGLRGSNIYVGHDVILLAMAASAAAVQSPEMCGSLNFWVRVSPQILTKDPRQSASTKNLADLHISSSNTGIMTSFFPPQQPQCSPLPQSSLPVVTPWRHHRRRRRQFSFQVRRDAKRTRSADCRGFARE